MAKKLLINKDPKEIKQEIFVFLADEMQGWTVIFSSKRTSPPDLAGKNAGEADWETKLIVVDPKLNTLVETVHTLIHEFLHVLVGQKMHEKRGYKRMETTILALEAAVVAVFSPSEISALLAQVFRKAIWDE